MSYIIDLGINLLAAFVGFLIGWLWQIVVKKIKLRKAKHFWKPFFEGELQIIVGRHKEFRTFEPSGFLGVGSAIGLSELRTFLESLGTKSYKIKYADHLNGDELKQNLILIGGPDGNSASKNTIERTNLSFRFGDPLRHEIAIYDLTSNKAYAPRIDAETSELIRDCGLIIRAPNPFALDKHLIIVAGSFGYGTWAGIRYLLSKSFLEQPLVAENKNFECVIETDIALETPQMIRVMDFREIN